jgi:competence protein ComEC
VSSDLGITANAREPVGRVVRSAVELHWPALLVGSACLGLALANWISLDLVVGAIVAGACLTAVLALDGPQRIFALACVLLLLGLCWGTLRMDALEQSVLASRIGQSGAVEAVTTAPARSSTWSVRVLAETRSFGGRSLQERVLVVLPPGRAPPRGSILALSAKVEQPRPPLDGFDERAWLARQGIHVVLRATSWHSLGRRGGLEGVGDRLRDVIERAVSSGASGAGLGVVLGVVLGEDDGLSKELRDDFRASGLMHLLAVSGQNVAFIVGGVHALGWLLRLSRRLRELLSLGAISAYVLAVGWQPSVVRAAVAGALVSLAWLAARPRDCWHFLAVGALVLLVWSPTSILDPGFQLSFAAVAAIFLVVPRLRERMEGWPMPRPVAEAAAVSTACGVVTAPILLADFDRAPLYTVVANALAFPAVPVVLALGLLAGMVSPASPDAASALAWLAGWAGTWIALVARVVGRLPGAQLHPRTSVLLGVALLLAWGTVSSSRHRTLRTSAWTPPLLAVLALGPVAWWSLRPAPTWTAPSGLRVTFLDVGQGDAALLETASARVLVDEGPPEADVAGQLARMGIGSLSAIVLTHPQRDHVGGAASVLRHIRVGEVLDPGLAATGPEREEAIAVARQHHVRVDIARAGDELRAGGLVVRVLWPKDAGSPSEDPNQNAVVVLASYGQTDVLFTADAESDVTAPLHVGSVEVLKVAHHGSDDPGLASELRELRPRIAVISCGRHNDYGHPRPDTIAALDAVPGLRLYRTDVDGRVVVESDGRRLAVRTAA